MTTVTSDTAATKPGRLSYTHEAMIDLILAEPSVKPAELAEIFGYSAGWISRVVASDSFQSRIAERKAALIDPSIARRIDQRFRAIAVQSTQVLQERLDAEEGAALALDALAVATTAMRVVSKHG
jgi:hypothetical protein